MLIKFDLFLILILMVYKILANSKLKQSWEQIKLYSPDA